MKALLRDEGETVTQDTGLTFINWNTGAPLTNREWYGGPYTLVNDYVPEDPASNFAAIPTPASTQDPAVEEAVPDTIVIDGVKYARTT